jgi:hydroxyethylthiazole kinase-like uncharacterized protein yjeF
MQRVLPPSRSLPLFGVEATRAIEQRATAALPPHTLMRRAGLAVARLALAVAPHAHRIWICAGPGNNGGDGLDAAIHLRAAGKAVMLSLLADAAHLPDDARDALERARSAGVAIFPEMPQDTAHIDLALDALLGVGASRAPDGALAACIAGLNALPAPVLAVDLPSGLHAGTGRLLGDVAVQATHTLALLTLKPGLFTASGRDQAGQVWFDDLGVDTRAEAPDAWLVGDDRAQQPRRRHAQHKGSFGDVAVIGGAAGMTGAALLAARAAHAAGAGRVYVSLLDDGAMTHDPLRPELMFRPAWWKNGEALLSRSTLVCGCGGGHAVREPLPRLLSSSGRLVLDADALNAIASDATLQALLRARASRERWTVLTPHPLEAARLLDSDTAEVQGDRLAAARELAQRYGCVVLLKGSGTVVAAPGLVPHINATGNAALATAGTGDVLAGWIGGVWSQSADASGADGAFAVACAAAYRHGAAAEASGARVLRAADLVDWMADGR